MIKSSPISSTKKKTTPSGVVFLFATVLDIGREQMKCNRVYFVKEGFTPFTKYT